MKLCKCNNCGGIFEDTNPSDESFEFPDLLMSYQELELICEDGEFFTGCPNCKTDGYLMDITGNDIQLIA